MERARADVAVHDPERAESFQDAEACAAKAESDRTGVTGSAGTGSARAAMDIRTGRERPHAGSPEQATWSENVRSHIKNRCRKLAEDISAA